MKEKNLEDNRVHAWPALRITTRDGEFEYAEIGPTAISVENGYRIQARDGDLSWMPKEEFERTYRKVKGMSFGMAIEALKMGIAVARKGWNGKGIYLELQVPDEHSKMTLPYIYIVTDSLVTDNPHAPKGRVPWLASQTDMLADDWYIVE